MDRNIRCGQHCPLHINKTGRVSQFGRIEEREEGKCNRSTILCHIRTILFIGIERMSEGQVCRGQVCRHQQVQPILAFKFRINVEIKNQTIMLRNKRIHKREKSNLNYLKKRSL